MATTPNYGWVTPAPTDFVTDLPADFEVFADAVDADLAGLLGGTTGQVLTKASGTDHDFAFADAGGGGGFEFITSATAANTATSLSVNNCFSATYDNYLIMCDMKTATESAFSIKLRVSGSDSSTGYYQSGFWASDSTAALNAIATANGTSFSLRDIGTDKALHTINVSNPFAAIDTTILVNGIQGWNGTRTEAVVTHGAHHVSTSYDGFSLISSSGNLTGIVRVYGYSNS
jgi:hypothetical protein